MSLSKYIVTPAILLGVTACGDTWGSAPSRAALSAPVLGHLWGRSLPSVLPGALIGGAVGGGVGAATTPRR